MGKHISLKMKICFVVTDIRFFLSHRFALAKEISNKHEVVLITDTSKAKPGDCSKLEDVGIEIIPLKRRPNSATLSEYLRYISELRKKINTCSPEYIFFITLELSMFGALIHNLIGVKKTFFLITGLGPFFLPDNFKTRLFRAVNKIAFLFLMFNKNFKFIFQNQDDIDIFLGKNISNKSNSLLISGSGINTKEFPFFERDEKKELTFLFAARLVKSKGFNEFMEAGKVIMTKYPETKFVVAGKFDFENPETISEKTYQSLKDSKIEFLGEVAYEEMNNLYKKTTIFVLPSYREGLPKVALEAASTGMPLILTNVPGCRECVVDNVNGYLIREKDSNDLISKMEKIILNPEIIKPMSMSSRKIIEKRFSLNLISQEFLKLIN
jgi:glycosyltransferase involved in cell wall biosynthesis